MYTSDDDKNFISASDIIDFKTFAGVIAQAPEKINIFRSFTRSFSKKQLHDIVLEVYSLKWTAGAGQEVFECCNEIQNRLYSYQKIEDIHLNNNVCKSFD
jgi:hypothetical protein